MSEAKAIVIGVNKYQECVQYGLGQLKYAENDAREINYRLSSMGFETKCLAESPTSDQITKEFNEFSSDIQEGGVFLFYFSGHGMSRNDASIVVLGSNETNSKDRLAKGGVSIDDLYSVLAPKRCNAVFLLDCCRVKPNGPSFIFGMKSNESEGRHGTRCIVCPIPLGGKTTEDPVRKHGSFTAALLDYFDRFLKHGGSFAFNHEFVSQIQKMLPAAQLDMQILDGNSISYLICKRKNARCAVLLQTQNFELQKIFDFILNQPGSQDPLQLACETMNLIAGRDNQLLRYKFFQGGAKCGNLISMYGAALCLLSGIGVDQNVDSGVSLLKRASKQGCADASFILGHLYKIGGYIKLNEDHKQALKWFRIGWKQGHVASLREMGLCYLRFGMRTTNCLAEIIYGCMASWCINRAAVCGDVEACKSMGILCGELVNTFGCGFDRMFMAAEFLWCRKAAELGSPSAQYHLGLCYDKGEGVVKDAVQAAKWYLMAAEQGHAKAQHNLAVSYLQGDGVEQDDVKALEWFKMAADQGNAGGQCGLGCLSFQYRGKNKDYMNEAVRVWHLAAEQGYPIAQYNLGVYYEKSEDLDKALDWYRKAADQGLEGAKVALERMSSLGWRGV